MDHYEVLVGRLNLRDQPNGAILTALPRATVLEATGPTFSDQARVNWVPVQLLDGLAKGYVCEQFVGRVTALGQDGPDPAGPGLQVTDARLRQLAPTAKAWIASALASQFQTIAAPHGILNSPRRLCHFLAQAAHESDGFRTLEEYGGPSYWKRYEGRADLGNTQPGDGVLYHGRGIFQLTGRANYREIGNRLGLRLETDPGHVTDPEISLTTACDFWTTRRLQALADANDIVEVTRRVNGGSNGLAERQTYFRRAWSIWGERGQPALP